MIVLGLTPLSGSGDHPAFSGYVLPDLLLLFRRRIRSWAFTCNYSPPWLPIPTLWHGTFTRPTHIGSYTFIELRNKKASVGGEKSPVSAQNRTLLLGPVPP